MRIHYLQHVPFEGPAAIEDWAAARGHTLSATRFFQGDPLPDLAAFDGLVILGGPMGVYDQEAYPWLTTEKRFLGEAIAAGKPMVGICLGAQLLAAVLGARVYRNPYKEIGWFPITLTPAARQLSVFSSLPERFPVFHWHGDTFDLPEGALHLAWSAGCKNQAFLYAARVLGLQFHLEATEESVQQLIAHGRNELLPDRYVQRAEEMLSVDHGLFCQIHAVMSDLLDTYFSVDKSEEFW
ncbi:MAG: type 1 glutamine amidotransferase [Nitrospinota bacterium]|nr:MAG: type 1 glutamine amidotransferase [Nitrospinota bacterium]